MITKLDFLLIVLIGWPAVFFAAFTWMFRLLFLCRTRSLFEESTDLYNVWGVEGSIRLFALYFTAIFYC